MEFLDLAPDLRSARLGFGCCPLGGHDWGSVDQAEILKAAHIALDQGINLFDTADIYGLGKSESALSEVLRTRRSEMALATKFGVKHQNGVTSYDNSPEYIAHACEQSLSRLGIDTIDIYQIHYWDGVSDWDSIFESLGRLNEAGKIRYVGLSNVPPSLLDRRHIPDFVVSFQMQFSLIDQDFRPEIEQIQKQWGLCFWSWGSLAQGMLSGKYGSGTKFDSNDRRSREVYSNFHNEKLVANQRVIEQIQKIALELGKTPSQVSLRYVLDIFPKGLPLAGIKSSQQLQENAGALGWSLPEAAHEAINDCLRAPVAP